MGDTLVIHPGALGDVLLAVPTLRALRASASDPPLVLAAQPRVGRLLVALGVVDDAVDFESLGLATLLAGDPHGDGLDRIRKAGRLVCWFGSGDERFGRSLRAIVPDAVIASPAGSDPPVWQHLRRTLGLPAGGGTEAIEVAPSLLDAGRAVLWSAGWDGVTRLVILHPGAGGVGKRWPVEGFDRVATTLRAEQPVALAVHQGPADAGAVAALRSWLGGELLLLQDPPLTALAGALRLTALYLGNDSGVSHLAAAVGAPTVVLFTEALLAWRPWAREARVVTVSTCGLEEADLAAVRDAAGSMMAHARERPRTDAERLPLP